MTDAHRQCVDVAMLARAIDRSELFLTYQPKIEITAGRMVGVEALVRRQHAARGVISPGAFIPLAESSGLIEPLTQWVIATAAAQVAEFAAACYAAYNCISSAPSTTRGRPGRAPAVRRPGYRRLDRRIRTTRP